MNLYLDASALVKRYVGEDGSNIVRKAMHDADGWFICRIGFVETIRAVGLSAGTAATRAVRQEWSSFGIVEVDERLAEHAAALALHRGLRSLDALHLAAAMVLPGPGLTVATWDHRLHAAAVAEGLNVLPADLP
ncbi:type II toxin-antitoxin system VapC family toxin [Baekduia sp.]|uniref:type II toxin-antitoxin system VapC family toxin n=1 Tax=Baekduia sp. TaxID=2600305 RepID=UPI002DFB59A1|nr:type II toxin-antitoxin system VapC family toxin [Baekduia sp.]